MHRLLKRSIMSFILSVSHFSLVPQSNHSSCPPIQFLGWVNKVSIHRVTSSVHASKWGWINRQPHLVTCFVCDARSWQLGGKEKRPRWWWWKKKKDGTEERSEGGWDEADEEGDRVREKMMDKLLRHGNVAECLFIIGGSRLATSSWTSRRGMKPPTRGPRDLTVTVWMSHVPTKSDMVEFWLQTWIREHFLSNKLFYQSFYFKKWPIIIKFNHYYSIVGQRSPPFVFTYFYLSIMLCITKLPSNSLIRPSNSTLIDWYRMINVRCTYAVTVWSCCWSLLFQV